MLLEMAIADAYGIGFEFVPMEGDTRPNTGRQFYQNPKYLDLQPGCYTDDTQRAIANAVVVLDGDPMSIWSYADAYHSVFVDDPRNGYSRRYQAFLESVDSAEDFIERIDTTAVSNGSIMGVLPIGFLPTPGQVRAAAAAQAMATHSYETVPYAQSLALLAHYYIYRPRYFIGNTVAIDWQTFLNREMRWSENRGYDFHRQPGPVKMSAHDTWTAVMSLQHYDSLHTILRAAVDLRGDTDSVAALAVGLASLNRDVKNDLPVSLFDGFEKGDFGADFLYDLETRLRAKMPIV